MIKRIVVGSILGAIVGIVIFLIATASSLPQSLSIGVICGLTAGALWPYLRTIILRFQLEDWRLEEVEIQGLKFISAGQQRRVAWRLFVQIATRISTQPLQSDAGDEGIALQSLYDLFQLTRIAVSEMEPTKVAHVDTVETYALEMLNSDLRPFLSKWHPRWEAFAREGKQSVEWPFRQQFRSELAVLQKQVQVRARGLAAIAGVKDIDRFFRA